MQHPSRLHDRRAFTLIELLTVIAIIGILAAILIPVIGSMREKARATQCVANLRSWGNATNLYVAENKGKLPVSAFKIGVWVNGVYQPNVAEDAYFHLNRYVLPPNHKSSTWGYNQSDLANYTCTNREDAGNNLKWAAYGFNEAPSALKFSAIPAPSRLIWATEAAGGDGGLRAISPWGLSPANINLGATATKPHGTKNNILYLDGHVASLPLRDVFKADFTRGTSFYNATDETVRMAN